MSERPRLLCKRVRVLIGPDGNIIHHDPIVPPNGDLNTEAFGQQMRDLRDVKEVPARIRHKIYFGGDLEIWFEPERNRILGVRDLSGACKGK